MTYSFKVRVNSDIKYWNWCSKHVPLGEWKNMIGLGGISETYCFTHEEDLMLFKLVHGV